jgi:hypothetical protein
VRLLDWGPCSFRCTQIEQGGSIGSKIEQVMQSRDPHIRCQAATGAHACRLLSVRRPDSNERKDLVMKNLPLHTFVILVAALAIGSPSLASDALARGTGGAAARLSSDIILPATWPGMRLPTGDSGFNHTKALHNGACRQYRLIAEPLYHRGPISYDIACEESSSR